MSDVQKRTKFYTNESTEQSNKAQNKTSAILTVIQYTVTLHYILRLCHVHYLGMAKVILANGVF